MQITFLIGNGFDIGIGLNTRYEDFYKTYCIENDKDNNNIKNFKKMLSRRNDKEITKIIDWADFEIAFGQHSKDFTLLEKDLYIEQFEDFVSNFNAYLENENDKITQLPPSKVIETMEKAIYTYYYIRNADKKEIERIYNTLGGKKIYNFISFNYTKSIDRCSHYLAVKLKNSSNYGVGKCLHIHGYVDSNMIMGVNDVSQIANPEFRQDPDIINEIVKPQQNIAARTDYESEVISLIKNSNIICIYGMSIGATDKKWWNLISEWLSGDSRRRLVILMFDDNYSLRFIYKQIRFTNNIINRFLSYSDLSDDTKKNIKNRIYIGGNHNVFAMDSINNIYKNRIALLEKELSEDKLSDDLISLRSSTKSQ